MPDRMPDHMPNKVSDRSPGNNSKEEEKEEKEERIPLMESRDSRLNQNYPLLLFLAKKIRQRQYQQ